MSSPYSDNISTIASEKIPLTKNEKYGGTYESLVSTEGGVIYCCHGKRASTCCDKESKLEDSLRKDHCHQVRDEGMDKVARNRLVFASVLCLIFMIAEIVGGILSNSLAIATDAAHLMTDQASFMISLMSLWLASRPATKRMSFGWYRAEVIGALTSVLLIWVVTGILVYMAAMRIVTNEFEVDATIMLITAGIGVLVNIIMGIALRGVPHGHSHGGGSSHSHAEKGEAKHGGAGKGRRNINVQAAFIHVIGDFIQSLGVFVAALMIYFKPNWGIVDPICTFIFSVIVLITTYRIIKEALNVLMEGLPKGIDFLEVQKLVSQIPGVLKVHNLRIWALSMDKTALSAHIAIDKNYDPITILKKSLEEIRTNLDVFEMTLQVEEYKEEMSDCEQCQDPKD